MGELYNYGYEAGGNTRAVALRLLNNQNLCKLLKYTSPDPLHGDDIVETDEALFNKNIKVVPSPDPDYIVDSKIVIMFVKGEITQNNSYQNMVMQIHVYVPLEQWQIQDNNLRPFAIMYEIKKSLMGKHIDGLGTIIGGQFHLDFLTDEVSGHILTFGFHVNA